MTYFKCFKCEKQLTTPYSDTDDDDDTSDAIKQKIIDIRERLKKSDANKYLQAHMEAREPKRKVSIQDTFEKENGNK